MYSILQFYLRTRTVLMRMNLRAILWPGDFLARKVEKNYEKFSREVIKKKSWWIRYIGLIELFATMVIGALFAFAYQVGVLAPWHVIAILSAYLIGAIIDPRAWRLKRTYGQLAMGVGYKASFLMNLDRIYHFLIGFVLSIIPLALIS